MAKDRSAEDIISESEYTFRMKGSSTDPQEDSPGDSEADAGQEFQMGLEFLPDKSRDPDLPEAEAPATTKEKKASPPTRRSEDELPNTARVLSSEPPAPWMESAEPQGGVDSFGGRSLD